jgi:hypothetical protein
MSSDDFVNWQRIDEPGDNPTWESQCGIIEQVGCGDTALYHCFTTSRQELSDSPKTNLWGAKRYVEGYFAKTTPFVWEYENEENRV